MFCLATREAFPHSSIKYVCTSVIKGSIKISPTMGSHEHEPFGREGGFTEDVRVPLHIHAKISSEGSCVVGCTC